MEFFQNLVPYITIPNYFIVAVVIFIIVYITRRFIMKLECEKNDNYYDMEDKADSVLVAFVCSFFWPITFLFTIVVSCNMVIEFLTNSMVKRVSKK